MGRKIERFIWRYWWQIIAIVAIVVKVLYVMED
jgi:hypothetical protein